MFLLLACAAPLPDTTPYVDDARVLAVQVEPAEAEPGADVTLRALYADAIGALATGAVDWAFCTARKPLAEAGPVASSCLDPASADLEPIGSGLEVAAALPEDACSRFGPNPPPPEEGEPAGRPADPDVTGGYYQPVLGFVDPGGTTLVSPRVRCGLANVAQETAVAWNLSYRSNTNPTLGGLLLDGEGVPEDGVGAPPTVTAGQSVTLTASWPECPATDACGGAETYVRYDPDTRTLDARREALSVSWYTTGGTFAEARNGRDGDDEAASVENVWTAPDAPGEVWLAAVVRDERGGVGFSGFRITVR